MSAKNRVIVIGLIVVALVTIALVLVFGRISTPVEPCVLDSPDMMCL